MEKEKFNDGFLVRHYENSKQNIMRKKNYYPDELKAFYTILSFIGEYWYSILQQIFDLPCYRTTQRYRNKFLNKMGISFDIFDEKSQNLQTLLQIYCKNNNDKRYVLSIDAISLKSYVSLSKNGDVKGLKYTKSISKEEAHRIVEGENEFKMFIKSKQN